MIQLGRYNEAMENFNLAVKEVKNKDLDLYYRSRLDIATFISEHYGDVMEALPIYKECYNYSKNQKYTGNNFSYLHTNVLFCLADAYKSLKKTDSCSYYNRIGYKLALKTNDEYYKYLFVLNEGSNQINKKKYKIALDSINKSLPKFIEFKDSTNVIAGYYYRGKAYEKLGLKNLAVKNFQLVDSVYRKTKSIFPEFTDGYTYLVNYYKRSGDKENHLKYLTQLTSIDSLINKKNHLLNKVIIKKYQIPNLIEKKDTTIQSLKNNYIIAIITTILSICLVLILFLNNKKQKKLYKERFQELIKELDNKTIITEPIAQNEKIIIEEKEIGINEEKLNDILEKLTVFENEKGFLKINLTIQNVADEFQTNTKYVSKIINEYKQKTFIQYINDLRIDYALRILQKDDKIRRFTILALANEFGFNTAESFSNAFSKKTGIKPSYFIKELNRPQTSVN
ncbi:helix-turn-helix domain-containing protein [Flavobacterium columnare]|uniref:helix-turn-helix domain-containing protein n=1 Tax=Flavobacterium columnare TaxID=996 RepID=UPI004033A71C